MLDQAARRGVQALSDGAGDLGDALPGRLGARLRGRPRLARGRESVERRAGGPVGGGERRFALCETVGGLAPLRLGGLDLRSSSARRRTRNVSGASRRVWRSACARSRRAPRSAAALSGAGGALGPRFRLHGDGVAALRRRMSASCRSVCKRGARFRGRRAAFGHAGARAASSFASRSGAGARFCSAAAASSARACASASPASRRLSASRKAERVGPSLGLAPFGGGELFARGVEGAARFAGGVERLRFGASRRLWLRPARRRLPSAAAPPPRAPPRPRARGRRGGSWPRAAAPRRRALRRRWKNRPSARGRRRGRRAAGRARARRAGVARPPCSTTPIWRRRRRSAGGRQSDVREGRDAGGQGRIGLARAGVGPVGGSRDGLVEASRSSPSAAPSAVS